MNHNKLDSLTCHSHFIRLVHPINISNTNFQELYKTEQEKGTWEKIPKEKSTDSYLGCIPLGMQGGHDVPLEKILYGDNSTDFIFFQLKDSCLQTFKKLEFYVSKELTIPLKLESLELIPFRSETGFISIAFSIPSNDFPFRLAIDANYFIPFLKGKGYFIDTKKDANREEVKRTFYLSTFLNTIVDFINFPTTIDKAKEALKNLKETKDDFKVAGNLDRLFLMSYCALNVNNQEWVELEEAKNFYHQITRWSSDEYIHKVNILKWGSPETIQNFPNVPTRSYGILDHGITCIGNGNSEFEKNNYLPKFRKSNFFALVLAWHIKIAIQELQNKQQILYKDWIEGIKTLDIHNLFNKPPRQDFLEKCLEYYKCDLNYLTIEVSAVKERKNIFQKVGESWKIRYNGGKEFFLRDSKGLSYISYLLQNYGEEISAIVLCNKFNPDYKNGSLEKYLDDDAVESYQNKLKEIEEALKLPDLSLDVRDELENERKKVEKELKKNKHFVPTPEKEKARKNVSNQIKKVLDKIKKEDKVLHSHLENAIQYGGKLMYDPDTIILWNL